jgi:hypothetical protein
MPPSIWTHEEKGHSIGLSVPGQNRVPIRLFRRSELTSHQLTHRLDAFIHLSRKQGPHPDIELKPQHHEKHRHHQGQIQEEPQQDLAV